MASNSGSGAWRRRLRLDLRGLIVVVLVIGCALGWIVHQARVQREAVAAIEKSGGSVLYDWDTGDKNSIPAAKPRTPRWLVDLIGIDYVGLVTKVRLPEGADPAIVVHIARLPRLQALFIVGSSVDDGGLAHLKGATELAALELPGASITDAGLANLERLNKLVWLDLSGTPITDAGLEHLKRLSNLSGQVLSGTEVTDAGLAHLSGLTKLSALLLHGTRVSADGIKELKRALPKLTIFR